MGYSRPISLITLLLLAAVILAGCGGGGQSLVPGSISGSDSSATSAIVPNAGEGKAAEQPDLWPMEPPPADTSSASRTITSAPSLISPINGEKVDRTKPLVFKWSAVSKAVRYMIAISASPNFTTQFAMLSDSKGKATQKTIPSVPSNQPNGVYYWRVRASDNSKARPNNNSQWGPYSSVGSFTLTGGSNPCGTDTTGTIQGKVTDASTNAALSGATVELDTGQLATTDSTGNYRIPNVPVGQRTGIVKKSGYLSSAIEANVPAATCVTVDVKLQPSGGDGPPPPPIFP